MLQTEIDAEVESAFKDLIEKLPPHPEIREHWMTIAKEQVTFELRTTPNLREAIRMVSDKMETLLSTYPTRRQ